MCQVNAGGSLSATWSSEAPEPIHLNFGMFDYIHSPTSRAKSVAAANGGWSEYRGEVPSHV